jgi:WD40 repeat protein
MLASASSDNTVKLWDTSTGTEIKTLTGHTNSVLGVVQPGWQDAGKCSNDKTVKLWDTSTAQKSKL